MAESNQIEACWDAFWRAVHEKEPQPWMSYQLFDPGLEQYEPLILRNVHRHSPTIFRRLGAKGSYLTLVRVADRIL